MQCKQYVKTLLSEVLRVLQVFQWTGHCIGHSTVTEVNSFEIPESPSGMFCSEDEDLLYIMCGILTNGDQYLYVYTQECFITIPEAVGMSRTDGFYVDAAAGVAYIADSQGPIYADDGSLGFNVYQVEWDNPCGTTAAAASPESVAGEASGTDSNAFNRVSVACALASVVGVFAL